MDAIHNYDAILWRILVHDNTIINFKTRLGHK